MTRLGEPLRSLLTAAEQLKLFAETRSRQNSGAGRSERTSTALVRLIEGWCVDHAEELAPLALGPSVRAADSTDSQILDLLRDALGESPQDIAPARALEAPISEGTIAMPRPAADLEQVLDQDNLPSFGALGAILYLMACGEPLDGTDLNAHTGYLGLSKSRHVWLIYQPDPIWLQTYDAASEVQRIADAAANRTSERHVVFAPARTSWRASENASNGNVEVIALPMGSSAAR